jgi:HK97 family phage portal protein
MKLIDRYLARRLQGMGYAPKQKMAGFMSTEIDSQPWARRVESGELVNYQDFIDAFRHLPWLYAGATAIAVAVTKPALKVYREIKSEKEVKQEEVEGEEINRLIELPNPFLSYRELIQITALNLLIPGNAYWNLVGTSEDQPISESNPPVELWWVKPEQVDIVTDPKKFISHYLFISPTSKEKKLDPSEIIHFKAVNPDSYFRGLGTMEAARLPAELEFKALSYNKRFMENDASPEGHFATDQFLEENQVKRFLREWEERHQGPKKAGKIDVTWGGLKYMPRGISPKDAQYVEMRKMNREEILATLGVPPSIVGLLEYANYSNMEIQQRKFWEDAVIPILNLIADKLTLNLAPHFDEDYWFDFDYSDIKALQEDEERKARIETMYLRHGLRTPNQIRQEQGKDPYKGGDKYYMEMSLIPVGETAGTWWTQEENGGNDGKKPGSAKSKRAPSFWQVESRKKVLWEDFVRRVGRKERMFLSRVEGYLKDQAGDIAARAVKAQSVAEVSAEGLLDKEEEAKMYAEKFLGHYLTAFKEAGDAGMQISEGKLYVPPGERILRDPDRFQITPEIRAEIDNLILNSGTEISKTTLEKISAMLQLGIEENWTVTELAKTIREKLVELSATRAQLISRTEAAKVENWGQVEGYKQTEFVELKGWLCSFVPDSRQAHMDADRRYGDDPIPLGEAFVIDGEDLQYPGDPAGGPGNVCNCLCSTYPEVRTE